MRQQVHDRDEWATPNTSRRIAIGLVCAAVLWCVSAGIVVWATLTRERTIGSLARLLAITTLCPAGALWAVAQGRRLATITFTALFGCFTVATGFSIGSAYTPALALLVWAMVVVLVEGPSRTEE